MTEKQAYDLLTKVYALNSLPVRDAQREVTLILRDILDDILKAARAATVNPRDSTLVEVQS